MGVFKFFFLLKVKINIKNEVVKKKRKRKWIGEKSRILSFLRNKDK